MWINVAIKHFNLELDLTPDLNIPYKLPRCRYRILQSYINLHSFHSPLFSCPLRHVLSGCREFAPSSRSTETDTKQVKNQMRVRLLVGLTGLLYK